MRRYSRFKICKTNFHFFFYSSRLFKFKRPKWNSLKIKLNSIKRPGQREFNFLNFSFLRLYSIPLVFKSFKYHCKFVSKKAIKWSNTRSNSRKINFVLHNIAFIEEKRNFDFLFHR